MAKTKRTMSRAEALGQVLRDRIAAIGLTQAEVSRRSGLLPQNVNALLRGARGVPSANTAVRVAAAVGWTAEELLAVAGYDPPEGARVGDLPVDLAAAWAVDCGGSIADLCGLLHVEVADPADSEGADRRRRPEA